jgi:hypothetical protein
LKHLFSNSKKERKGVWHKACNGKYGKRGWEYDGSRKRGGTGKHIQRKGRGRKRIRADFKLEI